MASGHLWTLAHLLRNMHSWVRESALLAGLKAVTGRSKFDHDFRGGSGSCSRKGRPHFHNENVMALMRGCNRHKHNSTSITVDFTEAFFKIKLQSLSPRECALGRAGLKAATCGLGQD